MWLLLSIGVGTGRGWGALVPPIFNGGLSPSKNGYVNYIMAECTWNTGSLQDKRKCGLANHAKIGFIRLHIRSYAPAFETKWVEVTQLFQLRDSTLAHVNMTVYDHNINHLHAISVPQFVWYHYEPLVAFTNVFGRCLRSFFFSFPISDVQSMTVVPGAVSFFFHILKVTPQLFSWAINAFKCTPVTGKRVF